MDRYKKKALAFANVEDKRNLRFIRKSIDRSNVRHKRLSELRKLEESTLEEVLDEKTPLKPASRSEVSGIVQVNFLRQDKSKILSQQAARSEVSGIAQANFSRYDKSKLLSQQEPKKMTYREKLEKWKEEKELKKQLEARKKIPVFKVGRANSERPPSSVHTVGTTKNKEPLKFVPKPTQPSRMALKPPMNGRDIPKPPVGRVAPRPVLAAINPVSRSIPNPKEGSRTIATTRNNSRQQPASIPVTKPAVLPSLRPPVKPASVANSTVSSIANYSTSRLLKPPASNICAPKQIQKPAATTTTASKIPDQRTGVVSRIIPPRSCNKQGPSIAKQNVSFNSGLKPPQQKKVPTPKGTKVGAEKQTVCDKKEEELEDTSLMDSISEKKATGEKKRASFAPDEFVFKPPNSLRKFACPLDISDIIATYASMFDNSLPRSVSEDKPSSKTESQDQKEDTKVVESKPEVPQSESLKLPEDQNVAVKEQSVSHPEDKNMAEKEQSVCQPEDQNISEKGQSVSQPELKDSEVQPDTTANEPAEENTQRERKGQIRDLPLYRQLRTISENSPLPNDLDLENSFTGEKTCKLRRSRRLASNHFVANPLFDPTCFQKIKPTSATGSGHLCPLPENPLDSPLAKEFSELSVDSPSATKQYNFRVRKPEQENRVSLLGSPIRPHAGPRKSIKGDLICFTP